MQRGGGAGGDLRWRGRCGPELAPAVYAQKRDVRRPQVLHGYTMMSAAQASSRRPPQDGVTHAWKRATGFRPSIPPHMGHGKGPCISHGKHNGRGASAHRTGRVSSATRTARKIARTGSNATEFNSLRRPGIPTVPLYSGKSLVSALSGRAYGVQDA